MQKNMKRRGLSFLLILAMLFVSIAVMLPIATSADGEFTAANVQKLESLDLANDDDTTLRFLFKIGKLDYSEVGFVFSKSNATPTIGGAGCLKKAVTAVYSSINAGGDPVEAGPGLFWVAIKMTDIPHEYFDGTLYARPYVIDAGGGAPRYDDVLSTTVCAAAGHVHQVRELKQEMIGGTASLNTVGTKIGTCAGCNLEVTISGVKTELEFIKFVGGGAADRWIENHRISSILGDKHFYPTNDNPTGNDLYAEYSILWNESLLNLSPTVNKGARVEMRFSPSDDKYGVSGDAKAIAYYSLTDNVSNAGTKIAGAFEYPCGQINTSLAGDPYPKMCEHNAVGGFGSNYEDFANIGGTDRDHPEWGWHRIGVRYHQEVSDATPLADVAAGTVVAEYELTVEVYIDGVLVSRLGGTELPGGTNDYKLYTVESDGAGGLHYEDMNGNIWFNTFMLDQFSAPTYDAYFIDGDFFVTAGHGFVQNVTRIDNPAARTETIDGKTFTAPFYYTTVGTHDHAWGELVDDASPAADCGHAATQSIHCTICGETKPGSTVDLPIDPSLHVVTSWTTTVQPTLLTMGDRSGECTLCHTTVVQENVVPYVHNVQKFTSSTSGSYSPNRATVGDIRGSEHFYTPGNDLLVEYSVLWTEGLTNLRHDSGSYKPYIDTRFAQEAAGNQTNKNIIYWSLTNDVVGSDCHYAGGFEWGGIDYSKPDNPYPKFTDEDHNGGLGIGTNINEFPNIGGANGGDGTPHGDDQWGWHRVQVRYRQEVANVAAVQAGSDAEYNLEMWVYVDGVLIIHSYATDFIYKPDKPAERRDYKLFTAASDGAGGITYTDINDDLYFHGAFLNSKKMPSGKTAYFEIADYSATIGSDFVQDVRKATNPDMDVELEVESGVFVPATMWYELKPVNP